MAREAIHVSFEEFAGDLDGFFERVIRDQATVLVENGAGAAVEVRPARAAVRRARRRHTPTAADQAALAAALGGWADIDTDAFLQQVYESRSQGSRVNCAWRK